ncbi:hypothetical protein E4P39_06915 [Blastococcus sp. CT_GayMR19]|uniref:hypothetical protein n=1 Tax=Blastococcus sp. CT_GayMR19 TaxID=2559608 RepID=UPI00107444C9|nr:hypothetical protein [Blastococcus sp. CT_GayMR19]TFV76642.1 hypothetical protein E4P39_06915 [Blastococcus sp. CT_GayMR19]
MTEPTAEQPQVTATVSPATPPRSRWDAIPHHLGRARTSTVILSLLFLAVGALWLNIRPDPVAPATTGTGTGAVVEQPSAPTTAAPTVPEPTTEPVPTTTSEAPTTSEGATTSSSAVTTPPETSTRFPSPTTEPTTSLPVPTSTPTG